MAAPFDFKYATPDTSPPLTAGNQIWGALSQSDKTPTSFDARLLPLVQGGTLRFTVPENINVTIPSSGTFVTVDNIGAISGGVVSSLSGASGAVTLVAGAGMTITPDVGAHTVTLASSASIADGDKGDITVSGSGSVWTIDPAAVSLTKMSDIATGSFIARATAGTGSPEAISTAAAKSMLGLTGTNSGDQTITLTGDVTGSGTGSFATAVANAVISYAKMQNVSAASRLLGRGSSGSGSPEELTLGTNLSITGTTLNAASGSVPDGDKGDITVSASGATWTIDPAAVTLTKMADIATGSFIGRATAGTGVPEVLSVASAKTLLNLTGTNSGDQTITLTGDVTGSGTGSFAATVGANKVTNSQLAQMAANTLKGNNTGSTANAIDLTAAQAKTLLAIAAGDVSGLGSLATASSVNLGTQATGTLQAAQEPAHTGDVTNTVGSLAMTIANSAVTLAKMENRATATFIGRNTAGTGAPEELSTATAKTMLGLTGTNSGDQNTFLNIAVSGQSTVVADATSDTLTLAAGSNITITTDAATDTITFAATGGGGGTATITETEINFGSPAVQTKKFTVTDASVTTASKILVMQSGKAATGRQADENEMDQLHLRAIPGTGLFTLIADCLTGRVSGKFKVNYQLG